MTSTPTTTAPLGTGRVATRRLGSATYLVLMSVLAIAFVAPLIWTFMSSLKAPAEANQSPPTYYPHQVSLDNYRTLLHFGAGLWTYLGNSLIVSTVTVVVTVVVSVLAGYGFARYRFRGKNAVFAVILAILMVPYPSILIALYLLLSKVGLQNSLVGLSLVLVVFQLPFSVYMMRNSFEAFPAELVEAALVDGASEFTAMRRIVLPGVVPGIVTIGLFSFLTSWNEFLAPLIFLNDGSKFTLPVMLVNVRSGAFGTIDYGALQAGIVVAMVPCIVLFMALQRFYISGLVAGAVKA